MMYFYEKMNQNIHPSMLNHDWMPGMKRGTSYCVQSVSSHSMTGSSRRSTLIPHIGLPQRPKRSEKTSTGKSAAVSAWHMQWGRISHQETTKGSVIETEIEEWNDEEGVFEKFVTFLYLHLFEYHQHYIHIRSCTLPCYCTTHVLIGEREIGNVRLMVHQQTFGLQRQFDVKTSVALSFAQLH